MKKPFSNFQTETKNSQIKPNISSLENDVDQDNEDIDDTEPNISSFVQSQLDFTETVTYDNSTIIDSDPTICSLDNICNKNNKTSCPYRPDYRSRQFFSNPLIPASDSTPIQIKDIIQSHHALRSYKPSKLYIRQHCSAIEKLPQSFFQDYCSTTFHVDGGANCGGVNDKRLLYFYVDSPSNIEQVGGDHVQSPGWGGILIRTTDTIN